METHTREHRSLLANAERRLLIAIAHRLPAWVTSDQLTLLGLFSMVAAGLAFATLQVSWLNVGAFMLALAANWFGDSLDGTLARVRHRLESAWPRSFVPRRPARSPRQVARN